MVVLRGGVVILDNPYVESGDADRSTGGSFGVGIRYDRFEADIAALQPGELQILEWRGKPVWVLKRSKEMLDSLKADNVEAMRSIEYSVTGGPEVLTLVERPVPDPGAGEVRVRKEVVTEQKNVEVPVSREEVVIERRPVAVVGNRNGERFRPGPHLLADPSSERAASQQSPAGLRPPVRIPHAGRILNWPEEGCILRFPSSQ